MVLVVGSVIFVSLLVGAQVRERGWWHRLGNAGPSGRTEFFPPWIRWSRGVDRGTGVHRTGVSCVLSGVGVCD